MKIKRILSISILFIASTSLYSGVDMSYIPQTQLPSMGGFYGSNSNNNSSSTSSSNNSRKVQNSVNGKTRSSSQNSNYTSSFGSNYQYDLNNQSDKLQYSIDVGAQLRDSININPNRQLESGLGQKGGGYLGY